MLRRVNLQWLAGSAYDTKSTALASVGADEAQDKEKDAAQGD